MPKRVVACSLLLFALLAVGGGCGRYMKLDGKITRVRVVKTGGDQNVLVVDFEATNNAEIGYIVRDGEIEIEDGDKTLMGDAISVRDARTICQHSLGGDCVEALVTREEIPPGATVKRMVAAAFEKTPEELENRKGLVLRIRELDRLETEFHESK